MRKITMFASAISALAMMQAAPAMAQDQGADSSDTGFADIIVTARRESESLQSTPVAVSVLNQEQFAAQGTFRPENIQASVPSVNTTAGGDSDRSNIIYTIRGQGFTYGALFPSVITYFADVPVQYLGVGQFYDTSLQILRGPQGVQFGRVTNGGNIMLNPNRPELDGASADITLKGGTYNLIGTEGFVNLPVSETLGVRFAWDVAKRDGFTKNVYDGSRRDDVNYQGGRLGLLWKPSDSFENYLVAQYQQTDDNGTAIITKRLVPANVRNSVTGLFALANLASELGMRDPVYGINPTTGAVGAWNQNGNTLPLNADNYVAATQQHVARQQALGERKIFSVIPGYNRRKYVNVVNTTTFDISDNVQIKNVLGYTRYIERSAQTYSGDNSGLVRPCHGSCPFVTPEHNIPFWNHEQFSEELRLSGKAFDNRFTWSVGGYMDMQRPAGLRENDTVFGGILEYLLVQRAKTKSKAVYGYGEFEITDGLKLNGGVRYTHDTVDSRNANYNALLPVPGLEGMVAANLALFGTPAEFIPFVANLTANSASLVPHGRCEDYNFGSFSGTCTRTKGKFNSTTWSFGGSYEISPSQLVYAKYSKGYRPGGVNATFPAGFENLRSFNPENVYSFEAGVKADWEVGSVPLRTNLTFYKDRYKGIQQSIQIRDTNGNPGSIVTNVAAAGIWGIEFEGSVRPVDALTLGVNYSYTDAAFNKGNQNLADLNTPGTVTYDACNGTAPVNLGFCNFSRFPTTPKHQLGVNWNLELVRDEGGVGTVAFGGNWYIQSSVAQSNGTGSFLSPGTVQGSYNTLNLNASWKGALNSPLDLMVFVTNVTNEIHWVSVQGGENLSGIGNLTAINSPPRMFGGSLTAHF
jgi:iron complex outermembrane receptor protein